MKQSTTCMTVSGTMLILLAVVLTFAQSESQSTKKVYQPNGSEGSFKGNVSLSGTAPGPYKIDMSADPVCDQTNPNLFTEYLEVSNGRLANVLIYVKTSAALEGVTFDTPATIVVLDQRGCRYLPHVLGIQWNQ